MTLPLKIDWIAGNCPVQAEGTINGVDFYFRARGDRWTFIIMDDSDYSYGEEYHNSGWMSEDEAKRLIEDAAELYVNRKT